MLMHEISTRSQDKSRIDKLSRQLTLLLQSYIHTTIPVFGDTTTLHIWWDINTAVLSILHAVVLLITSCFTHTCEHISQPSTKHSEFIHSQHRGLNTIATVTVLALLFTTSQSWSCCPWPWPHQMSS